jgi:hypothetical protein
LHQQNFTGTGKIIAIMDGGFPGVNIVQPFERLRTNNQILGGYNFVGRDTNFMWEIRMVPMCYLQWEGIKMGVGRYCA